MPFNGRALRSIIDEDGTLRLSLEDVSWNDPGDDEIVVRIEATPINPSDLGLLLGPADVSTLRPLSNEALPGLVFTVPENRLKSVSGRLGQALSIGNEGAGTVIAAGRNAKRLEGKKVGMVGGAMYADYRLIQAKEVTLLPDGVSAADGASMFVNPLTALGFVETARREGHCAIVHSAAASNLGQMLQRICLADGIPLINIVRSQEQADILRKIGATYVLNSQEADFQNALTDALAETGATIAFDPIGGGPLATQIIQSMERVAVSRMEKYNRYGSEVFKQLYVYGALNPAPIILDRLSFGFEWSVSGWLLFPFLRKAGEEVATRLRQRVVDELTTTFQSHYTQVIGLAQALEPQILRAYERRATGEKFLIDPTLG